MAGLNQNKVQIIKNTIDGEKLAKMIQEIPEERAEKVFQNRDIKKLAERLSEDMGLFEAVMSVYDNEKAFTSAMSAVPGNYTREEFDEFRMVYANLFLKDFHEKIFMGKKPAKVQLTEEELDQVAGGGPLGAIFSFIGKGVNFVVDKLPISESAKKCTKLIVSTVSGVASVAIGTVMCCTGVGAVAGGITVASGALDLAHAVTNAATMNK
ncbi:hypothetical protein D081_1164 [Anaerovibrio sp. JC8]|uniref:hypothetical protein n=1 Tax=Anaerovibrio sp. JC8 TaxID=1240085 RepID=UPI000A0D91D3|nr:hypothetical protein [Anaerovibrio sp. JC8]ORU00070.1 hypothetical protein D081_1164 [Anaerovibrio sp. JC8]